MVKYDFERSKLEFSLGGFIGVIATILTLVLGFYSYVISPKFDDVNLKIYENKQNINQTQKELNEIKGNVIEVKTILIEMKENSKH